MSIADLRTEYTRGGLLEADAGDDPVALFRKWFEQALAAGVPEPNAMTLCTCAADGRPSGRIVLLKEYDERGFSFFTNYHSHKGHDLGENPHAALVFHWVELERQVRIEGTAELLSPAESDAYFASRPLGSRLGAWASEQSAVIDGREGIEAKLRELQDRYPDGNVPRPPHWGGYRVVPVSVEFWQGRPSRLHDRIRFRKVESGWRRERLSP